METTLEKIKTSLVTLGIFVTLFCTAYIFTNSINEKGNEEPTIEYINLTEVLLKNRDNMIVIGADWCDACRNTKHLLGKFGVKYRFIEIEDLEGKDYHLKGYVKGNIPVILFPDVKITGFFENEIVEGIARNFQS